MQAVPARARAGTSPARLAILGVAMLAGVNITPDRATGRSAGAGVKKELLLAVEPEPEAPSSRGSWLACTLPPMAVPLSYSDT